MYFDDIIQMMRVEEYDKSLDPPTISYCQLTLNDVDFDTRTTQKGLTICYLICPLPRKCVIGKTQANRCLDDDLRCAVGEQMFR